MRYYNFRKGGCPKRNCCPKKKMQSEGRGRPLMIIEIEKHPEIDRITPEPILNQEPVFLSIAEFEALRLVDLHGLSQEEAGEMMNISRTALWRLVNSAREKMAKVLIKGQQLIVGHKTKI